MKLNDVLRKGEIALRILFIKDNLCLYIKLRFRKIIIDEEVIEMHKGD